MIDKKRPLARLADAEKPDNLARLGRVATENHIAKMRRKAAAREEYLKRPHYPRPPSTVRDALGRRPVTCEHCGGTGDEFGGMMMCGGCCFAGWMWACDCQKGECKGIGCWESPIYNTHAPPEWNFSGNAD